MIKKTVCAIVLLGTMTLSFSQEKILEFSNSLKTSLSDIKDVIPITNKDNGDLSILIADAKNVYAYKFDKDFKPLEKLISKEKRRKFKTLIGNSISSNGDYIVYLTNKFKNKFLSVKFSFANKTTKSTEFKLKSPKEKFIQTISTNNKFYIISARKDVKSLLYIYSFDALGTPKRNSIDVTHLKYKFKSKKQVTAPYLLTSGKEDISKIDENLPNSIEISANKIKMYERENSAIFFFDNNDNVAQTLEIDLNTFKASGNIFNKPLQDIKPSRKESNSFLNGNTLFLSATTKEKLIFSIVNFKTGEVIKNYTILKDDPITFKNTPIIQEGGMYNGYREMEKTKKFLRKINKGKFGISARKIKGKYLTTIGGYVVQASAGSMMFGALGGIPLASIGNVSVFFNPTMFAYNSMSNTKSTRIESLFDENFNHVKGKIGKNVFEKIKETKVGIKTGETVFKYKDYFIRGYYKSRAKKYYLTKFIDD